LEKLYAELSIKIKKSSLKEKELLQKWQQIIKDYQNRGIDVTDCSIPDSPKRSVSDEICVAVRAGKHHKVQITNKCIPCLKNSSSFFMKKWAILDVSILF